MQPAEERGDERARPGRAGEHSAPIRAAEHTQRTLPWAAPAVEEALTPIAKPNTKTYTGGPLRAYADPPRTMLDCPIGMKRMLAGWLGVLVAWALLGCSGADEQARAPLVELFSWWTKPGEAEALDAVLAVHEKRHPGAKVINAAAKDSTTARDRLRLRLEDREPPDTFQANVGQDLLRWVLYDGADAAQSKLEPLSGQAVIGRDFADIFPEPVLSAAGFDGEVYAVPVNVHRTNSLFYNRKIFDDFGLTPPQSLEELYAIAEVLELHGIVPLAVGAKGSWTLSLLFFENLLIAKQGADFYEQYFGGNIEAASDPRMLDVLSESLRLWRYTNADARQIEWDAAVAMVHDGTAAMTVMGDWAKGTLEQLGGEPGVTFGQMPFPGTAGVFVFTADTFPLPKGAPRRKDALDFLGTLASLEGQNAFNPIKGSIPARTDIDPAAYDVLAQDMIADFRHDQLELALSGRAPAAFNEYVQDGLGDMVEQGDPEPARFALMNRYDVLQAMRR
jgi:glucose/mannose transport system substrate-binding protein